MQYLSCHITLANRWHFKSVNEISISETMDSLTDTAKLILPRKIRWKERALVQDKPLKRGEKVSIELGYNGQLHQVFTGFIRNIAYEDQLIINCENQMFELKKAPVKPQVVQGKLQQLIAKIVPSAVRLYPAPDHNSYIGIYRITESSVAKELANLKKQYNLQIFFLQDQLFIGWLRPHKPEVKARFLWQKNIIESELSYQDAEDAQILIKATALNAKGKRIQLQYGEQGGEERSLFMQNATKESLKAKAKQFHEKLKKPRYQGKFTSFGEPIVNKGDSVYLEGKDGNKGTYLVKQVERNFGRAGYRQIISLDYQIS